MDNINLPPILPDKSEVEECKVINGFGDYEVSSFGRIKSLPGPYKKQRTPYMLKPWKDSNGYLRIQIGKRVDKNMFFVHLLVALHFIPNPKNLPEVNHIDGNTSNSYYKNLEWNTHQQNMEHAAKNGLMNGLKGERNHFCVVTEKDVIEIRESSMTLTELSEKYSLSKSALYKILNRSTWNHI